MNNLVLSIVVFECGVVMILLLRRAKFGDLETSFFADFVIEDDSGGG
jgi:hypothetical protein